MSHSHHLTILERERIFRLHEEGVSIRGIGNDIHRSPATTSRERRRSKERNDAPSKAEKNILLEEKTDGACFALDRPKITISFRRKFRGNETSPSSVVDWFNEWLVSFSGFILCTVSPIANDLFNYSSLWYRSIFGCAKLCRGYYLS